MTVTLGTVAIALALSWALGGLALRAGGALVFWVGLLGLTATGDPQAIIVALVGGLVWLAGQAHFALRHGAAKSPLARALLAALAALLCWLARATGLLPAAPETRGPAGRPSSNRTPRLRRRKQP
jgi:hypothetical protein